MATLVSAGGPAAADVLAVVGKRVVATRHLRLAPHNILIGFSDPSFGGRGRTGYRVGAALAGKAPMIGR